MYSCNFAFFKYVKYSLLLLLELNDPNFDLYELDFLSDDLLSLTGTDVSCESNKGQFNGFVCVVFVIRTRLMRSVRFSDDAGCISETKRRST
jgi:hypothetical protein